MAIQTFLAMTAAEIVSCTSLPPKIAWMGCRFSQSGRALSGFPETIPPNSLLVLDDSVPFCDHDKEQIAAQLIECVDKQKCCGVLLDFQKPNREETASLAAFLSDALPCPAAVSEPYAGNIQCPIFLPPVPHHIPLADYLSPWKGREIWLELALDSEVITLTESGSQITPLPPGEIPGGGHREEALHCHYRIELSDNAAYFILWRSGEDLNDLLAEAKQLGISTAVGLYQELSCRRGS